ncbi:uncharacterized protein LOC118196475 [Stegodyphus dumicola]|uniref:uncharacterized protein LOC118196475 n=1 Tax=Stegodyphus dumicola TaxID=202533 RepID=UPI0015B35D35|nr:uncharacterized protein LOC118196475 [Stegodyphus dumicola]
MYVLWLRKWRKTHRKVSDDDRRKSSLPDEMEIETLKTQAFSSISMHCSFDSPTIVSYLLDSKEMEIRRRAMSHIPISPMSSFGKSDIIPRQAMSFSEGNPPRSLPSLLEVPQFNQNNSQLHVSYKHDEDGYVEITKF